MNGGVNRLNSIWKTTEFSSVGIIDTKTDTLVNSFRLVGKNPFTSFETSDDGKLYVGTVGGWYEEVSDGGIEELDVAGLKSRMIISEAKLGGKVFDFKVSGDKIWALLYKRKSMDGSIFVRANLKTGDVVVIDQTDGKNMFRSIAYDKGRQFVFVSQANLADPQIRIYSDSARAGEVPLQIMHLDVPAVQMELTP